MKNKLFILLTILLASTLLTACSSNKTKNVKAIAIPLSSNLPEESTSLVVK